VLSDCLVLLTFEISSLTLDSITSLISLTTSIDLPLGSSIYYSSYTMSKTSSEALLSNIIPFAGSGLLGYAMGFALKKILKWMLIIVGFLAGMFFVGVQLLQKYGYVSTVNWDKLGNDTSTQIQHFAASSSDSVMHVHGTGRMLYLNNDSLAICCNPSQFFCVCCRVFKIC
jgi:uncharacterized membrane protein (Fun14 family)